MSGAIVVFAKAPRPGRVKTRMCPPLRPEQAAELYEALLEDALDATAALGRALGLDLVLAMHPHGACAEWARRAPPGFRVVSQRGRDLAERMSWAVAEAAAGGTLPVLLRGSDCPLLGEREVRDVLVALGEVGLAVCPDLGGGYSLIGLRGSVPGLFDHPMSTATVLEDTLANARASGLRTRVLQPSLDLDEISDLAGLAAARADGGTQACPRTLAWLDERGLWPT